jgi:hypothetical protein
VNKIPARYLARFLLVVSMGLAAVLILVPHFIVPSLSQDPLSGDIAATVALVAMAVMGTIVVSRYQSHPIGWLLMFLPLTVGVASFTILYAQYALNVRPGALPGGALVGLLSNSLWIAFFGQILFLVLLFPDGRLLSARWRWVAWGLVGALVAVAASTSLRPELDFIDPPIKNSYAIVNAGGVSDAIETTAFAIFLLSLIAAMASLVLRFIRSNEEERQQIKWFAYMAGIFLTYFTITVLFDITGNPLPQAWEAALFSSFILLLPAGTAVAILKYRLYDIDLLISRTLIYGPLTATLAGAYVASIIFFRLLFVDFLGVSSDAAIATTTLVIAALFVPARNRFQSLVDKLFKEDEFKRVSAYSREAVRIAELNSPAILAKRFLALAIDATGATGCRIVIGPPGQEANYAEGKHIEQVAEVLPLTSDGVELGKLELGPKHDGRAYLEPHLATIQTDASLIAKSMLWNRQP